MIRFSLQLDRGFPNQPYPEREIEDGNEIVIELDELIDYKIDG
jgi:hypothetical protein